MNGDIKCDNISTPNIENLETYLESIDNAMDEVNTTAFRNSNYFENVQTLMNVESEKKAYQLGTNISSTDKSFGCSFISVIS